MTDLKTQIMTDLKTLNLTDKDFDLLIEGLDALPEKGAAGEIMGSLIEAMILKDAPENEGRFKSEREKRLRQKENQQKIMIEDIKILQGKLLMLKRYLTEQDALTEVQNLIKHVR